MLRLTKHHGLGNDFLVALEADNPGLVPDAALAVDLCDRRRGVGADGLLYGLRPEGLDAEVRMVLHNSDGSEAEISGNGIRCLAQAVLRRQGRTEGSLAIESRSGLRRLDTVRVVNPAETWLRVDMGEVREGPAIPPEAMAYPAERRTTLDVGNPHLVLLVEDPHAVDLEVDGPALEAGFPTGINVHMIAPTGRDALDLRVWERGAGITEACGSGATVAAYAAHRWGLVGERVQVTMPGGEALIELHGDHAALIGPAVFVAEVLVPREGVAS